MLHTTHAIPRKQQRLQSRAQREVAEDGDVVVGEVDGFVVAGDDSQVLDGGDLVTLENARGTNESTSSWEKCSICSFQRTWGKVLAYLVGRARAL